MLPKLAFFASTIDELTSDLRPAVEHSLAKHGIPASRILVNVGDAKETTNDDIREFNRLDTQVSEKQFILLVNKGREGWNCRSLFGVGLYREPKSKIFVLQASMRCLRSIGDAPSTLATSSFQRIISRSSTTSCSRTFGSVSTNSNRLRAIRSVFRSELSNPQSRSNWHAFETDLRCGGRAWHLIRPLGLDRSDKKMWNQLIERYRLIETQQEGFTAVDASKATFSQSFDLTLRREKRRFSRLTLVAEVARYLNSSPTHIEDLLDSTKEGTDELMAIVNDFNELLYDEVIPRLFRLLFDLEQTQESEEQEVELIKLPSNGYYEVTAAKDKIVHCREANGVEQAKSFHLDTYCFDSNSEKTLFWDLLRERRVKKVYFTGMLTHGQTDFFIQYIDPESKTVRSYYPDFVFLRKEHDGSEKYVIVEVKGDHQIDNAIVQAKKEFTQQIAVASGTEYRIIKSTDADNRRYRVLM